ncbi:hypothetical protein QF026_002531 [Streptomyces aurantiacus]|nr:hypothetical protein [Streptomyces aurantiacus]
MQRVLPGAGRVVGDGAPADGVDTGEEFSGVVGLHHVVVGAEVEAVDPGAHVGPRGDHDDGCAGPFADLAADLVSVLVGQSEVEEHHSETVALRDECLEGLRAAAGVRDSEAVACEDRGQSGGDMVVVLDQEQSHYGPLRFIVRTYSVGRAVEQGARARVPWQSGRWTRTASSVFGVRPTSVTQPVLSQ